MIRVKVEDLLTGIEDLRIYYLSADLPFDAFNVMSLISTNLIQFKIKLLRILTKINSNFEVKLV